MQCDTKLQIAILPSNCAKNYLSYYQAINSLLLYTRKMEYKVRIKEKGGEGGGGGVGGGES